MSFNLSKMACLIKETQNKARQGNSMFRRFLLLLFFFPPLGENSLVSQIESEIRKSDLSFHCTSNITEIANFNSKCDSPLTKPNSKT